MTPDERVGSLEPILNLVAEDAVQQIRCHNHKIRKLVNELGGGPRRYCRERAKKLNRIVAEIYSPPRVTAAANLPPSLKLCTGFAVDLTTVNEAGRPWDFSESECREERLFWTQARMGAFGPGADPQRSRAASPPPRQQHSN